MEKCVQKLNQWQEVMKQLIEDSKQCGLQQHPYKDCLKDLGLDLVRASENPGTFCFLLNNERDVLYVFNPSNNFVTHIHDPEIIKAMIAYDDYAGFFAN